MIVFPNIKLSIYMYEVATAKVYEQHVKQKTLLTFWTMIHAPLYDNNASHLFSERMASKYFENENLVIISSNDEIDMTKWRKYISEKWNEVIC